MAAEPASASDQAPAAARRALGRLVRRQFVYFGTLLAAVILAALILSTAATAVQAGRNEARNADIVVLVSPTAPSQAMVDHSFELYRRGYAPQLVVVGPGGEGLRIALQERGVAEGALVVGENVGGETADLRLALATARATGASSVVVAGDAAGILRWLKLAGDEGLRAYGAPTPGANPGPLELLGAGARYWRYALLRR